MFLFDRAKDYEVTCVFKDNSGQKITKKRVCHNVSRREAKEGMKHYIFRSYSNSMDVRQSLKIETKATH
ncbi:hypothetical protein RD055328_01080 [Companilactobacillus sp. RD055328]|uniref:hypothetical protein n=1 Tax=Companilactobacillus sp. RD055328 TaxID=2916634 RepID=UPI001FC7D1EC|nr:hypothetical protein [Companilactobacillus sp. RD055328]GKQ42185.1 hypothetical protein RD055328_01080 [Companilactobacillus sp. RD055328]